MDKKVILLVEDDPDCAALTLRTLESHNITNKVVVARDGVEALDYLLRTGKHADRDPGEVPVLVLLDLRLPKLDGLEVLRRLRVEEQTSILPVVILTSSKEEQDLVSGYRLGANSYIRKPVNFARFAEAIKQLGLYWLVLNEPPPPFPGGKE